MAGQKTVISKRGVVSMKVAGNATGTAHGIASIFP
jgi:hypothetical protein